MRRNSLKKIMLSLLVFCLALSCAGCAPSLDSKEDPLSGYTVDSILPFNTNPPSQVTQAPTATPVPQPTQTVQQWQNDTQVSGTQTTAKPATVTQRVAFERLELGDQGEGVKQLQERLIELGYLTGTADGDFGSKTKTAVKRFQSALGLSQTGVATVTLQEKLFMSNAPIYVPTAEDLYGSTQNNGTQNNGTQNTPQYTTLIRGDKGDAVMALQQRLIALNYLSGSADGDFGSKTETAIKRFQAAMGLSQNGVASPALQEKLFAANAPYAPATATPKPTATPAPVTKAPTQAPLVGDNYIDLEYGDIGDEVVLLQQRLKALGYFTGSATGKYYSETQAAVKRFQEALGLTQTGVATASLQTKLFASNAPAYQTKPTEKPAGTYTTLKSGSKGDEVRNLQKRLAALGYFSGTADGDYGKATENAVKLFQNTIGYSETGVATEEVQQYLFSPYAPYYSVPVTQAPTTVPPTAVPPVSEYRELRSDDAGDAVKNLQKRLKELGFYTGSTSGDYEDRTEAAVRLFEKAIGWNQDGVATVVLQQYLYSSNAPVYNISYGFTPLLKGDSGAQVRNLQSRLIELGFLSGRADGDYGTNTENAVKAYQQAARLTVDGKAGLKTLESLYSTGAPTAAPTTAPTKAPESKYTRLSYGSSGDAVKNLQQRLLDLGYFSGNVLGNYKEKTQAAVVAFQAAIGWTQDGVATPDLQAILFSSNAPAAGKPTVTTAPTKAPESKYTRLSYGDSGTAVKNLQQRLKDLGYFDANVAGNYKEKTQEAVVAFQRAIGWTADGVATADLQEVLYSSNAPVANKPTVTTAPTKAPESKYTRLSYGDSGTAVKNLQQRLKDLGYFDANVAGNYKEKTQEAVVAFQRAIGWTADGVATVELQEVLFSSRAPQAGGSAKPDSLEVLSYGDRSSKVAALQQRLIALGWLNDTADGEFGGNTRSAIENFQYRMGINTTGIADIQTQEALYSAQAPAYVEYVELAFGDQGEQVVALQKRLIELGYLADTRANADGDYGNGTMNAVMNVQRAMSMTESEINGIADVDFQTFLFSKHADAYAMR